MDRVILHCDCNSFFASVETAGHPEYARVPMAVAGSEENRHGIILAKNELAKAAGIVTAQTVREAKRLCPGLLLVSPHYSTYAEYSLRVRRIYEEYTDLVEPFGMDECWLDVTGSVRLFGDGREIAEKIRARVRQEVGITVSVGVSFNKVFAKLGSDYKKPDAVTVIDRAHFHAMVDPMPVDSMIYVGRRTAAALADCGVRTIGELGRLSDRFLTVRFGKLGEQIGAAARGEDISPVASAYEKNDPKSVGSGMTFRHDLHHEEEIRLGLTVLAEDVAFRLRKAGKECTTLGVTVKDEMLKSVTRQMPVSPPTALAREMIPVAMSLVQATVAPGYPIRMLTVTAMNLIPAGSGAEQIGFFDGDKTERREKTGRLEHALDAIRGRYGREVIGSGAVLGNDIGVTGADLRHSQEKKEDGE